MGLSMGFRPFKIIQPMNPSGQISVCHAAGARGRGPIVGGHSDNFDIYMPLQGRHLSWLPQKIPGSAGAVRR